MTVERIKELKQEYDRLCAERRRLRDALEEVDQKCQAALEAHSDAVGQYAAAKVRP